MFCNLPCRMVLFVINFITSIIGVILLAVGSIMIWGKPVMNSLLSKYLLPFIKTISPGGEPSAYSQLITRLLTATSPIGITLFTLGCVIFIVSLLGYLGACCNSKIIYYTYELILALIATIIAVAIVVYYFEKQKVADYAEKLFAESVHKYKSMQENNVHSLVVGFISPVLKCCGINNATDFTNMSTTDIYGNKTYKHLEYPVICCKMNSIYQIIGKNCPQEFTTENSNAFTGCREPVRTTFVKYMNYIAIGLVVTLGVLLLFIAITVFTVCMDFL